MNYRIAALSLFMGIIIGSFCIGQGKSTAKNQGSPDVQISDHGKVEKLMVEVAELQKKLTALTQRCETHTHQLRNLAVAQLPGSIECNQNVVGWSSTGTDRGLVDNVCRQVIPGSINVLTSGKESPVTSPPHP
jgi:hypothetical protein